MNPPGKRRIIKREWTGMRDEPVAVTIEAHYVVSWRGEPRRCMETWLLQDFLEGAGHVNVGFLVGKPAVPEIVAAVREILAQEGWGEAE